MQYKDSYVDEIRRELIDNIVSNYDDIDIPIKLKFSSSLLDKIVFDECNDRKRIAIPHIVLSKLDLSNVKFDNVDVTYVDFTGCNGVKINPQKVYGKSLYGAILDGVTFVGSRNIFNNKAKGDKPSFNDVNISGCNFTNSKGAIIIPNQMHNMFCHDTIFRDATILGSIDKFYFKDCDFDGCLIYGQTIDYESAYVKKKIIS